MQKGINQFLVFMTVFAVVVTSFINPTTAYADDGTGGGETSEPAVVEEQEPVVEDAAPTETVEEIMEQIPEGTEIIVVNEEGEIEPLASEEAAQAILEGDPMWCPDGSTPGDAGCTVGFATFQELIDVLVTDNGTNYSGNGVIWVAGSYTNADNAPIVFDGSLLSSLGNLAFMGGWSGGNNTTVNIADLADLDVSLSIFNWTGDVSVSNLNINAEDNYAGLYVETNGNITLNNVTSSGNSQGAGAFLDGTGNVNISDSTFADNGDNGVWVQAEGDISLTDTDATNNGFDGADLINYEGTGDVSVTGGDFSDNDEAGLYIITSGNVFVDDVVSNNNRNGINIDNTDGSGDVEVSNSTFDNNTWTGAYVTSAGDITVDNVSASDNGVAGTYLDARSGIGNIFVQDSTFNGNGQQGLRAFASDGDITLMSVLVDGENTTKNGAWVKTYNGDVWIEDSTFTQNVGTGLLVVAGGQIDLVNVTATFNGGNGVEAYSTYTFACFGTQDIPVNVDGGTYTDNGDYGLYVEPGAGGSLVLNNNPVFSGNGMGDYLLEQVEEPCPPAEPDDEEDKPSNVVEVPEDGGEPVVQDCEAFANTILVLHNGTTVKVDCPFNGSVIVESITELPGKLPVGLTFGDAISIGLDEDGTPVDVLDEGGLITITFVIPEELLDKHLSILYWDPTANDGLGDWVELPLEQFGGAEFPLYPEDPEDGRMICSGFDQSGNTVSVTINFPGVFVLVAR